MPRVEWLTTAQIAEHWPTLGEITGHRVAGSGVKLSTSGGDAQLKHRPADRIAGELWVLDRLTELGLPVTRPVLTAEGRRPLVAGDRAWFVYRELPGATLPRMLDDPAHAELLGATCASLGVALCTLDVDHATRTGIPRRPLTATTAELPVQVIHRDFHAGNVLFTDGRVSGYLDFDHLEIGPRIVDLVYLAGSVLAELYPLGRASELPRIWACLRRGYESVSPLSAAEQRAVRPLLIEIERDFADWFDSICDPDNAALTRELIAFVQGLPSCPAG